MDWSDRALNTERGKTDEEADSYFCMVDLVDSFYQMRYEDMTVFFALQVELLEGEVGVSVVWDPDSEQYVDVDLTQPLFPA